MVEEVPNTHNIKQHSFQEDIINQPIEELIRKAIETQVCFEMAMVLYRLTYEKYSYKSYEHGWIDKLDSSLSHQEVVNNVKKEINTSLKSSFESYSKHMDIESTQYKDCLSLIEQLKKHKVMNEIMIEAREIFFEN